ncbi:MAG TPA: hypothetical protein PKA64_04375 [Myxococcota bacterium]|nr:hypothetical protein [Myxococcota bacterium]
MIRIAWLLALTACTSGGYDITADDTDAVDTEDSEDTPDDTEDTPDDTEDTEDTPAASNALVGDWVSQGADIAPLLAGPPAKTVRVDASFRANGSYSATAESEDGSTYTFTGSYTVDTASDPGTIEIAQTSPYPATVRGLWAVARDVLTYDVVDVSIGTPATPGGGFGSSSAGPDNVQTYRRP